MANDLKNRKLFQILKQANEKKETISEINQLSDEDLIEGDLIEYNQYDQHYIE